MITLRRVRDFIRHPELEDATRALPFCAGWKVKDYLPPDFDLEAGNLVALNDTPLSGVEVDTLEPQDGDVILAGDVPKGIGGVILAAAMGLKSAAELSLGMAALGHAISFIVVGALSVGLSYGIAALAGPANIPRYNKDEDGPTRNFDGIQNTVGNGYPIPFVYGEVRMGGHFLSSFERQLSGDQVEEGITTLHTLLGLGVGPMESIGELQINGNDIDTVPDVTYAIRYGVADQAPIDGFFETVHEVVHQAAIAQEDGPLTFFTTSEVDALEVIFRFPAGLFRVSDSGKMRNMDVEFAVNYRAEGAEYYTETFKTVGAKTRSPLKSIWKAQGLPRAIYEIVITRITEDDEALGSSQLQYNSLSEVYAISEIHYETQTHPGLAMVGIQQVPSAQMNNAVPTTYTALVQGFNDIRIYTDVDTYDTGYTENPAWCCAHFLTHPLIGWADTYEDIDLASFLEWADRCDEQVLDGRGGLEKRCTMGHVFDQYQSADRVLEVFTQGSGATLMRRGKKWYAILDREDEMVWNAHEGNSKDATLTYLPQEERANRIRVTFTDRENDYQRDSASLEWEDLVQGDVFIDASRELFGVTRRTQAEREITRLLLHNKLEHCRLELEAGLDSLRVYPGKIFGWNCLTAGVGIASGRILSIDAAKSMLELDTEVTLEAGKVYEVVVQHQSDSSISTKRIASAAGIHRRVAVIGTGWPLQEGDLYALGEYEASIMKFRCVSATLQQDFTRKIIGMQYDPLVYTGDLGAQPTVIPPSIPDPRLHPPDVTDLNLLEHQVFAQDGTLVDVIDVDWAAPVSATLSHYEVWYREEDALAWDLAGTTRTTHFEIVGVESPGVTYRVAVVSVSTVGVKKSIEDSPQWTVITEGLLEQPPNISGLSAVLIDGTLVASCQAIDSSILGPGGYYEWRRGSSWSKSTLLDKTTSPRLEIKSYSRGSTYILVKAYNSVGNSSPQATSFQVTLYGQVEENVILTDSEAPGWTGTMQGLAEVSDKLELSEPSTTVVWSVPSPIFRRTSRLLGFGFPAPVQQVILEAYYTTQAINVSSSQVVRARADANVDFDPINIGLGTFDDADFAFEDPEADIPFSGDEPDKVVVRIESRVSTTDTEEASWSAWAEHRDRGELEMKYIQFRIHVQVESDAYGITINDFTYAIDLPDKVVSGSDTAAVATAQDVDYPTDYFVAVKRLLLTLIGGTTGDYFRVTAQDADGFTYEIRDSSHSLTTGTVHWEARGY